MGNLHLVTGYAGQPHVSSADQASFVEAFLRGGQFVLDAGAKFAASIVTNNQVRVNDGEMMMQGRHVKLDPGSHVDLTIDNGAQGYLRHDLIVVRYTRNTETGVEECSLVVIKGTPAENNPADPEYTTGDINAGGALQHDFPLYRVKLSGLTLNSLTSVFAPEKSIFDLVLHLAGGTMAGSIAMGGHKVTGLGTPSADSDAATLGYANSHYAPIGLTSDYITTLTETELSSRLSGIFQGMGDGTVKVIRLNVNANGLTLPGGIWFVTLYRTGAQYGFIEAVNYSGGGLIYTNTVFGSSFTGWKNRSAAAASVAPATVE